MSTKELYTSLLESRVDHDSQMIFEMDEAIHKWIQAEQYLNMLNQKSGSSDLLRRRLKLILCEQAAKKWIPIAPANVNGSDAEQLQVLAVAIGCPKITTWLQ